MDFLELRAADGASGKICSHGAHLCSWVPAGGNEQLFLSKTSEWRKDVAIRGGVPVIFPQFAGLGSLPKHGFARTAEWQLIHAGQQADGSAIASYQLRENIARLSLWPHLFQAELSVRLCGQQLQLEFSVLNTGDTALQFTCALHTYLALTELAGASLHGLQGCTYRDSLQQGRETTEQAPALLIEGETDRIYLNTSGRLELRQDAQVLLIEQAGFSDTVVWNPGASGAVKLSDFDAGAEQRMLCVEAAQVGKPVRLAAGQRWQASQHLSVVAR